MVEILIILISYLANNMSLPEQINKQKTLIETTCNNTPTVWWKNTHHVQWWK